jgi:hypothetical protein
MPQARGRVSGCGGFQPVPRLSRPLSVSFLSATIKRSIGSGENPLRLQAIFLCLSIAACSSPQISSAPPTLPTDTVIATTIQSVFAANKIPGTPEVSPIRSTLPLEPGDWIICLKSSDPDRPLRYAIFFEGNKYFNSRIAVGIDNCDQETYAPPKK